MIGSTISHYRILDQLGRGGMGIVYKAEDTKLDRTVALKLLPPGMLASDDDRERFYREARAAAALHHPNVATVFEINETPGPGGEPQPFIAIEFVDGESLADLIEKGPLPTEEAISITSQIADGLHVAHEKGIVHRDVKPANIMMSSDGRPKILDFGVARFEREAALTQTGSTIGTTAYMSPEQVRGEPVDRRSDLWSLGIVFHELLTGTRPFQGDYEAAITFAILNEDAKIGDDVPAELQAVLQRLLAKDVSERYDTALELTEDLRDGGTSVQPAARPPSTSSNFREADARSTSSRSAMSRRTVISAAVGLVIIVAAAFVYFLSPAHQIESIAVLPFRNTGDDPDLEYLSDGLTETLINSLSQVPDLRVMARSTVFQYKGRAVTPGEVGEDLDVRAVLVGDITQRAEDLRINAELVDVADGAQLWGGSFNQPISDIIQIQDALAGQILDGLRVRLTGEERQRVTDSGTQNSEAYQLYLKGLYHWNRRAGESLPTALGFFQQAVDQDPQFALGHAGLANTYVLMSLYGLAPPREVQPKARTSALRALELDPNLAEARSALATVQYAYDWDWDAAEASFKRAISDNPNYPTARQWYGEFLATRYRVEESVVLIQQALDLDPLSIHIRGVLADYLLLAGREEEGLEQLRQTLEMDSSAFYALWVAAAYHLDKGQTEMAAEYLSRALALDDSPFLVPYLAHVYAQRGDMEKARNVIARLDSLKSTRWVSPFNYAVAYAAVGDRDRAFESLRQAVEEKSDALVYLEQAPGVRGLRDDPRYDDILESADLIRWADR